MICIVCGTEHSRRGQYCSKQCQQKYYYEKNKQERKEYKKQHYILNKDIYKENHDEWIEKNRDKWNEYQKEYKRKEREEKCQEYI